MSIAFASNQCNNSPHQPCTLERVSARRPFDVAVIGSGIAGLASSVLLRQEGFDVVCLDTHPHPHHKVGESLDWSTPGLLRRLGIAADSLLAGGIATPKQKIVVCESGRSAWMAAPPAQIRRDPLRFETMTLHVDRTALDSLVYERATALGTTFIWERVASLDMEGERVRSCTTSSGRRVEARWFIDATGTARLFAREMGIPVTAYGRRKVCVWTYFDTPPFADGTVFFVDNRDAYLGWVWDIPISPRQTSVGFVVPADVVRDQVRAGHSIESILHDELRRHPRFDALLEDKAALTVESTSFQPYVTAEVCGANWLMVGEAASMPDPLTGNGVTSGIRHARHACEAIRAAGAGDAFSRRQRRSYARHVFRLGHAFNAHIERAIYQPQIRWGFSLKTATYVYTFFAFFMNALHARFDPRGRAGMATFAMLFAGARVWISGWVLASKLALRLRPAKRPPSSRWPPSPPTARTTERPAPPGGGAGAGASAPA
jgi:flavin-dependent dehydrogenase